MFGRLIRIGGIQIMDNLKNGPVKISQVKNSVSLYGSAFDLVLSELMISGLVRKFDKDGEEYIELTELGRNIINYGPYYGPYGGYHGHKHHEMYHGYW
ncbi:hypothetical protein [Acidianus manzaensis]|uniref:ArnR1-like winged helix-turn-helix domain-containing protein n=1 Tax=Acidianus manzaensis TaxID=282676 RepID=A0A1W6JZ11_9CREN|nr:hypothetical protein [Acidianus manzaensis]ARM75498.1 hypothetical protein B6F84_05260 [Acidianus manzaensis]